MDGLTPVLPSPSPTTYIGTALVLMMAEDIIEIPAFLRHLQASDVSYSAKSIRSDGI